MSARPARESIPTSPASIDHPERTESDCSRHTGDLCFSHPRTNANSNSESRIKQAIENAALRHKSDRQSKRAGPRCSKKTRNARKRRKRVDPQRNPTGQATRRISADRDDFPSPPADPTPHPPSPNCKPPNRPDELAGIVGRNWMTMPARNGQQPESTRSNRRDDSNAVPLRRFRVRRRGTFPTSATSNWELERIPHDLVEESTMRPTMRRGNEADTTTTARMQYAISRRRGRCYENETDLLKLSAVLDKMAGLGEFQ